MRGLRTRWRLWRLSRRAPDDEARIEYLRLRAGSLLDEPQEIAHWLYVASAPEAAAVADALTAAGFAVTTRAVGPEAAQEWQLVASRQALVTVAEIEAGRSLIRSLVDDYDGWLVPSLYEADIEKRVDRLRARLDGVTGPAAAPPARIKRPPKRRRWRG